MPNPKQYQITKIQITQTVWNLKIRICLVFSAYNLVFGGKEGGEASTIFLLLMGD